MISSASRTEILVYFAALIALAIGVAWLPAPPFSREPEDHRYLTMAYAPPRAPVDPGAPTPGLTFGADLDGTIWAARSNERLWTFGTAPSDSGESRVFLTPTGRSVIAASTNGNLYELEEDGRLRAAVRVGWAALGPAVREGDELHLPVLERRDGPRVDRVVNATAFRVLR